jgi:hypothetical protein
VNAKKLLAAAVIVEGIAAADLNMFHWNTCAMAHVARAGKLKGLTLWVDPETFAADVEYGGTHHFDAIAKCFGIETPEAVDLFGGYNTTPTALAADIRAFVHNAQEGARAAT